MLFTFYSDLDGDGYGSPVSSTLACTAPSNYVDNTDDCDDNDNAQFPGAEEYCNGEDDIRDGQTDENSSIDVQTWYYDADGDSYGNPGATLVQCYQATNYVAQADDCDDDDPLQTQMQPSTATMKTTTATVPSTTTQMASFPFTSMQMAMGMGTAQTQTAMAYPTT